MRNDLEIVVAVDRNWGIGLGGTQTLVIPEDRRHFRAVTGHGTVILGRKTLADFPGGRPLKGRRNIVLTRNSSLAPEGAEAVHSVQEALSAVENDGQVFVIGGASVYAAMLPWCSRAHVTYIHASPEADVHFPNLERDPSWRMTDTTGPLESNGLTYEFQTWDRI